MPAEGAGVPAEMQKAWRICVVAGLAAITPITATAQIPSSDLPGRERDRFEEQQLPLAKPAGPKIILQGTIAPQGADAIELVVTEVRFVGATVYDPETLSTLDVGIVGRSVPLVAVYALAQEITAKYGNDGYVLSRAIVPPQELDPAGAVVTIEVVEGYVDSVVWPPSLAGYRDFFTGYGATITAERPTNINTVMRALLLAGDLPGIDVSSRFEASATNPNASTLVVEATEKPFDAEARIDNRGTVARGPWEFLVSRTANNLLRHHEAITLTYAGALETRELQYVALGYRQVLTSEGVALLANGKYSWGRPGTEPLELLEFDSHSFAADAGLSLPVIRSREQNVTLAALGFFSDDQGDILAAPNSLDRLRGFRLKADFDSADERGTNQLNAVFSQGIEGLGSTANDNPLASRENGRVDFTKIEATISRVEALNEVVSVRAAAYGQFAATPLLAPEECGYGGKDFGRAFDPSEISGDSCWAVSGKVRFALPPTPGPLFQSSELYAFVDFGAVYRIAPAAGTPEHEDASSAGFGLRLGRAGDRFSADLSAVKPLHGRDDDSWRTFLSATARY